MLTPFERNLEVWRQLWRVIERSHLIVQIVDARNPLKFRCEDLEAYVQDVEGTEGEQGTGKGKRKNVLLINKADLLTAEQRSDTSGAGAITVCTDFASDRRIWADYFDSQGLRYAFYSATNATAGQETLREASATQELARGGAVGADQRSEEDGEDDDRESTPNEEMSSSGSSDLIQTGSSDGDEDDEDVDLSDEEPDDNGDARAKVLSVLELEDLLIASAPDLSCES